MFLCLLGLEIDYIELQRRGNNFHRLIIKTKRILGLKLVEVKIIMTYMHYGSLAYAKQDGVTTKGKQKLKILK